MGWNGFDTCLGTMAVQRCGVSTATTALHHWLQAWLQI